MEFILPVTVGICLSACTGFRAFLPPFIYGLILKFIPQTVAITPNQKLLLLAQTPVLLALGIAVLVEFLADKIPVIDHLLDVIELPVKFITTTALNYMIVPSSEYSWIFFIFAFVLGTSTTVTVHASKAGFRTLSTTSTGGFLNPAISLVEEFIAVIGTFLAIILPIGGILFLFYIFWRCLSYFFRKHTNNDKSVQILPSATFTLIIKYIFRLYAIVFHRLKIIGVEAIPQKGPYVVVANHASMIDGFVIGASTPYITYTMVKKEAFENPVVNWFLRKTFAFPVDREKPDPSTIKTAFKALQDGYILTLFPEGTRNPKGLIRPFKPGALKIAIKQKVPIVPAYLANTHLIMPEGTWIPRPVKITLKFGNPIDINSMLEKGISESEIQEIIYEAVCSLGKEITGKDVKDLSTETTLNNKLDENSMKANFVQ